MNEEKIPTIQEIVARYLPGVDWDSTTSGRVLCPGHALHSHQPAHRDARVFVNGVPTLTCYHDRCQNQVKAVNEKIRAAWSLFQPPTDPKILAEAQAKAQKKYELETRAKASLPVILKEYRWDVGAIMQGNENGCDAGMKPMDQQYEFFCMFPRDTIWVGEPDSSGRPEHRVHFIQPEAAIGTQYHYTCASIFKPGVYSRANDNVATTPFMVVEGDRVNGTEPQTDADKQANKNSCGAIFKWLVAGCGLNLRAVVDSGNKSLHGWFDMPSPERFDEFRIVLPALGCDRAMFKPTQPCRIPGVTRDNGKPQRLLYLN